MRKIPLCAWCGGSLRNGERQGRGTYQVWWDGLSGSPMIGWHAGDARKTQEDCFDIDPISIKRGPGVEADHPVAILEVIELRGPDRVTRLKRSARAEAPPCD